MLSEQTSIMAPRENRPGLLRLFQRVLAFGRRTFPISYYWLASVYQPIKCFFFLRKYPKIVTGGPKIVLLRGEDGPDKLWAYGDPYAAYLALRRVFDVELLIYTSFREKDVEKVVKKAPALLCLGDDSGRFQALFERHHVPLVGSGSATCQRCYDKLTTKQIASQHGICTAPWHVLSKGQSADALLKRLKLPLVVKPRHGGSSVGVSRAYSTADLGRALRKAFRHDKQALVEEYIAGEEYTCTVYGNDSPETLPVYRRIMRFERQEMAARGEKLIKTRYPVASGEPFLEEISSLSKRLYTTLRCNDMIRVDWKYDVKKGRLYFLEVNILPWLENPGFIGEGAGLMGSSYEDFIVSLFRESLNRKRCAG